MSGTLRDNEAVSEHYSCLPALESLLEGLAARTKYTEDVNSDLCISRTRQMFYLQIKSWGFTGRNV